MKTPRLSFPVLTWPEKTALLALALILGSGAALRAWEHSGVELGPVKDWDTLRAKIVMARSTSSDSVFPCSEVRIPVLAEKWPQRPSDSVAAAPVHEGAKAPGAAASLNINTAPAEALDQLPGIGPAMAKSITEYRRVKGPFRKSADLLNVKGIGPKKLSAIKPLIRFTDALQAPGP